MLEIIRMSIASLMRQRTRTFLTMFGIIWGIAAVIILVSIIQGFKARNQQFFAGVGVNKLVLEYSDTFELDGAIIPLKHDVSDRDFILKYCPNVEAATIETTSFRPMERVGSMENMRRGGRSGGGGPGGHGNWFGAAGVSEDYTKLRDYELSYGRLISVTDEETYSKVCVVGSLVVESLWEKDADPVGQQIAIGGVIFTVVGALKKSQSFNDFRVLIPYSTYESALAPQRHGGDFTLMLLLKDPKLYEATRIQVIRMLAARHGFDPNDENAISVEDFARFRDSTVKLFSMLFILVYFVGMMTLAIGAVGVTNIMLVNVKERTKEIGLRKALGATRIKVLFQFITEALLLTVVGGLIGIAVGLLLVSAMYPIAAKTDAFPTPVVTLSSVIIAAVVNVLVGVIAGSYPASQAASLDPIASLRDQ
jgi:putative ABC transport system permease protein